MYRQPEELPDEHVLKYPSELSGDFLLPSEHRFVCSPSSAEAPTKELTPNDNTD